MFGCLKGKYHSIFRFFVKIMLKNNQEIGGSPVRSGDSADFFQRVKLGLESYKNRYKFLFPLIHPITVIIAYRPSLHNPLDADNLASKILKIVVDIFNPPSSFKYYNFETSDDTGKITKSKVKQLPEFGVMSYQVIVLPRTSDTPVNGEISIIMANGLFGRIRNVWWGIEDVISSYEDEN